MIGAGILLLMAKKSTAAGTAGYQGTMNALKGFLQATESFSAKPLWDYEQWSWGYGTKVPGSTKNKNINPGGTITRDQAWIEALKVINDHYDYLVPMITRTLGPNKLAALLSFSYNLGKYDADNLMPNINKGNDAALFTQMRKYVNAGGVRNQGLVNRREKEIKLWTT